MSVALRTLLIRWLNWLACGVVLSTAFSIGLLHFDVGDYATLTLGSQGGMVIRTTIWAVLALFFAPCVALTDELFRDLDMDRRR